MRKNTARHWLHAALDLLPVILIPVFMIYSHRHVLTERTEVDIQYKYQSNEVITLDDLVADNLYKLDNFFIEDGLVQNIDINVYYIGLVNDVTLPEFDSGELEFGNHTNFYNCIRLIFGDDFYQISYVFDNNNSYIYNETYSSYTFDVSDLIFSVQSSALSNFKTFCNNNNYLPQYTDYNVIESVDVQDTNSSIMNVFMDDFNYTVNKYFNMGNVFNLKDVYHWFEVNIFNNNPPVVMASIYNIIVYEFVMDLLFLLYGLFMWFIDMLKRLIEKPIDSIK